MKTIRPTRDDFAQLEIAIKSFPGAFGRHDAHGNFQGSILEPNEFWLAWRSNAAAMDRLWQDAGLSTSGGSAHPEMMRAKEHHVSVGFFKVRKGLFRTVWLGNVHLDFDNKSMYAGSIAGRTQSDMWRHLHAVLDGVGERELYKSPGSAYAAA
jgi:hypothetical protein